MPLSGCVSAAHPALRLPNAIKPEQVKRRIQRAIVTCMVSLFGVVFRSWDISITSQTAIGIQFGLLWFVYRCGVMQRDRRVA
jgi:hypothetical protein